MTPTHPEYLVDTGWLAAHLDDPTVRILDVTAKLTSKLQNRAEAECYEPAHVPGSMFFDVPSGHGVLSDPDAPLPWTWPTSEQFVATMARFGIDNSTRVVLVARTPRAGIDSGTMWCTRAWWTMHHMGADVAILRGGLERWEAEGRPLVSGPSPEAAGAAAPFVVAAGWERGRARRDDVLAALGDGSTCVVDALPATSYDGSDAGYGERKGHITGARNLPFRSLIDAETADFPDLGDLRGRLETAGLLEQPRIIAYCGGAIAATVDAFALRVCGHEHVAVYDGSLMEWSADPSLPMTDPSDPSSGS